jgi:16S rRNA (cytidine1402-2'-O)-methyltransferase
MVLALMGSGFNGQRWRFTGYLPIAEQDRRAALLSIERELYAHDETQIFMETPYRNQRLLDEVVATCRPETLLCVATDLTTTHESIITKSLREWRADSNKLPRSPAIFLLGR